MKAKPTPEMNERQLRRFMDRIEQREDGCWIWVGSVGKRDLPIISISSRKLSARRLAYALRFGQPPEDMYVVPVCGNEMCVQPFHLMPVDSLQTRQTHCKRNHPLVGDNVVVLKSGKRTCRICLNMMTSERNRRYAREGRPYRRRSRRWYERRGLPLPQ